MRHLGWGQAADLIIAAMSKTILAKQVTCDFAQLMLRGCLSAVLILVKMIKQHGLIGDEGGVFHEIIICLQS